MPSTPEPGPGAREAALDQREAALRQREMAVAAREREAREWVDSSWLREKEQLTEAESRAEAETQNSEIRQANEHLMLATIEAQELREAAQLIKRRQDEFLAMLAHELRNPLGPILNAVEILARLGEGKPVPASILGIIRRQVQQMARLIDDLLDVSRITLGKVTLHRQPAEIAALIQQAVEATDELIRSRGQQLVLELPADPLWVEGDAVRLTQVFANLLHNAAKYTPVGGSIVVRTERKNESVVVRVRDDGVGISAQALPHVFELFSQDERTAARSQGGLGIGLTVVRRMVELHQGTVEAFSAGPGLGSEFVVTLPRLDPGNDAELAAHAGSLPTAPASAPPPRARVLLIEDNVDAGEALAMLLRHSGHEVTVALDGQAGLDIFARFHPHVVLCDIGLPGLDGHAVAAGIRQGRPAQRPVMVALTGYGGATDQERTVTAGFDHHLVKPADPDALLRIIDSAMRAEADLASPGG